MNSASHESAKDPQDIAPLLVARARAGDVDGMAALYAPDAVLVTGETTVARGTAEIRAFWAKVVAQGRAFNLGSQRPALRSGDLALTSTLLDDGRVTAEVARREPDGSWRWVLDHPAIAK